MKRTTILFALLAVFAFANPAFADPDPDVCTGSNPPPGLCGPSGGDGGDGGSAGALALAAQLQGQAQGQGQQQGQDQGQGQAQGQIGINDQDQGQGQGQFGFVKTDLTIVDKSVHEIDNDFPVNQAAPVFAGNCSQGVSAQFSEVGASIASGNVVCDYIAIAGGYIAAGDREGAFRNLAKAEDYADWRAVFGKIRMVVFIGLL